MLQAFLYLMKAELLITVIIMLLLFLKLGSSNMRNETLLNIVNLLLLINLVAGFFLYPHWKALWRHVSDQ